jgi:hypothetical protein
MDDTMEARIERVRHHLRRPLAGRRQPIMKTASYTLNEIVPHQTAKSQKRLQLDKFVAACLDLVELFYRQSDCVMPICVLT